MIPEAVPVVCMAVGHRYPDRNVAILESMLRRFMPTPFTLTCIVDRPRRLPPEVKTLDASAWGLRREGMRVTTDKLGLFEPGRVPFETFLYLDTTLVIQRDMTPLLEYAFERPEELVVLKDWNYDAYNTCVMRIRSGGKLAQIAEDFRNGASYPWRNPGDQDFVTAYVRDKDIADEVVLWPEDFVVSYRNARALNRTDPAEAKALLEKGIIVKFFGKPKMHQLVNPLYRNIKMKILGGKVSRGDAEFWVKELKERWR